MLTKLCFSVFFLSWAASGLRVENNGFDGLGIDHPPNLPRFPMDMNMNEEDRIYGGHEAAVGQFPYQILIRENLGRRCGGSILNERFVLTAAHCVNGSEPRASGVLVGAHEKNNANGTMYNVQRFIIHEGYVKTDKERLNDIALIQTAKPIQFNDLVRPIRLHRGFIKIAKAVTSGWGRTNDRFETLKYLNVTTLINDECSRLITARFPNFPSPVHNFQTICAFSGREGHGVCSGDSGGPLAVNNQLVGVTSFAYPCALGIPDGYTRVSTYISWINSNMKKF